MFLTESKQTHNPVYESADSVLETIIDVLQEYSELKTDMIKTEANYLINKASGFLTESEENAEKVVNEKKESFWERLKALLVRLFNAVKSRLKKMFGRSKDAQDKIKTAKQKMDEDFAKFSKDNDLDPEDNPKTKKVVVEILNLQECEEGLKFGLTLTRDNILSNPSKIINDIRTAPVIANLEVKKVEMTKIEILNESQKMHNLAVKYLSQLNTLVNNNGSDFNFKTYLDKYGKKEVNKEIMSAVSNATTYINLCISACDRLELRATYILTLL